jgi:hypothetical protein
MAMGGLTEDTFIDATGKVFGLQGLDITALDASADGASTGYTLLVRRCYRQSRGVQQLL